jgi:hypothetical protein
MNIKHVTLTGADDTVGHDGIFDLSEEFPFVEWGILFSKSAVGKNRFPTYDWIIDLLLLGACDGYPTPNLSAHLCGRWVRDICKGEWTIFNDINRPILCHFNRFQLNFHSYVHKLDREAFAKGIVEWRQIIFQLDDVNNDILDFAQERKINAVGLYDISGGKGILPENWPQPRPELCGYAGGLGPENLDEQLAKLSEIVGDNEIYIDMETKLRDEKTDVFDYEKCRQCLQISKKWMNK